MGLEVSDKCLLGWLGLFFVGDVHVKMEHKDSIEKCLEVS